MGPGRTRARGRVSRLIARRVRFVASGLRNSVAGRSVARLGSGRGRCGRVRAPPRWCSARSTRARQTPGRRPLRFPGRAAKSLGAVSFPSGAWSRWRATSVNAAAPLQRLVLNFPHAESDATQQRALFLSRGRDSATCVGPPERSCARRRIAVQRVTGIVAVIEQAGQVELANRLRRLSPSTSCPYSHFVLNGRSRYRETSAARLALAIGARASRRNKPPQRAITLLRSPRRRARHPRPASAG